jgi:predicted NBD/HSP70 family sugar kinase
MKRQAGTPLTILVLDVGGSHVKCIASGQEDSVKFSSGPNLTPNEMVAKVLRITKGWRFDAVSIGYPGVVRHGKIAVEPHNLGRGWVGFDFQAALARPVKVINDAAMQALGGYQGGAMLFLGLGTGLGSALIVDGVIVALELGHLPHPRGHTYEHHVGEEARKRVGNKQWRKDVEDVVEQFRQALLPDDIVLGGGNALHLKHLPPQTRRGENANAFLGGFRLWDRQG